jgi:hypothetical protein
MDSNHDNQLQRLVSYQLDDPGVVELKLLTSCRNFGTRVNWVNVGNFRTKIRRFFKFRLHKIRSKMSVASNHLLTAMANRVLAPRLPRCFLLFPIGLENADGSTAATSGKVRR